MSGRFIGMLVAGVLLGVIGAVIGLAFLTAPPPVSTPNSPTPRDLIAPTLGEAPGDPNTPAPTLNDITSGAGDVLQGGEDWTWRSVDSAGRPQAIVTVARLDPIRPREYRVTDVEATFYRDGREIVVTAASGEIRGQRGEEPEYGFLTGGVSAVVRTIDAPLEGDTGLVFETETMSFDTTLGQAEAPGEIRLTGPGLALDGQGLTLRFGTTSATDDPRLLLVKLRRCAGLKLWPDRFPRSDSPGERPQRDGEKGGTQTHTADEAQPTDYRFTIRRNVRIERDGRSAQADTLEVFARLFSDAFREGAIKRLDLGLNHDGRSPDATGERTVSEGEREPAPPIEVTWDGPLELQPLIEQPGVLDYDDAVLRFASDETGRVVLQDERAGLALRARTVTYFATTAYFEARARSPEGVSISTAEGASLSGATLDVDLSASPRLTTFVRTPGVARDADGRSAAWSGRADLEATLTDGRVIARGLSFDGDVTLDGANGDSARADALRVAFDDRGRAEGIEASGSIRVAQISSGRSAMGDRALLTLVPSNGPALRLSEARLIGNVRADQERRSLESRELIAIFAVEDDRANRIERVIATGDVRADLENDMRITCAMLRSDERARLIDLIGDDTQPVSVAQTREGMTLRTVLSSARYETDRQRLTGFGSGTGTLSAPPDADAPYREASLAWGGGLVYDDRSGVLELLGGVDLDARKDEFVRHRATCHRAELDLTPDDAGDVHVTGVRLYAGPDSDGTTREAIVEARRQDDEGELVSLLEMRGLELLVRVDDQRIESEGAGRLVAENRRAPNAPEDADARTPDGTTVFHWNGGMVLELDEGVGVLTRDIRVRHLARETDVLTLLDCQRLVARFAPASELNAFEIQRLDASESVFAGHEKLELLSDELIYRASSEQLIARASEGNRVTLFDPDRAGHYTARSVLIDLVTGNWTSEGFSGAGNAP